MITILVAAAFLVLVLLGGALTVLSRRNRTIRREWEVTHAVGERVLQSLSADEPLPTDVELLFPDVHPATGASESRIPREAFVAALRAGPFGYPSVLMSSPARGPWTPGFWGPPISSTCYVLASGWRVDVVTRRHDAGWQVAVVNR